MESGVGISLSVRFSKQCVPTDRKLIRTLGRLIDRHFRKRKKPEFYADALNVTSWRLNFLTTCYRRKTVYEMLQERRHKETLKLLTHTTLSVKEISYLLGFNDPPYFIRHFKKLTGETPRSFRTKINKHE